MPSRSEQLHSRKVSDKKNATSETESDRSMKYTMPVDSLSRPKKDSLSAVLVEKGIPHTISFIPAREGHPAVFQVEIAASEHYDFSTVAGVNKLYDDIQDYQHQQSEIMLAEAKNQVTEQLKQFEWRPGNKLR